MPEENNSATANTTESASPQAPAPTKALNVLILTYHEVTQDARVFKQARALVEAGHRVQVLCDWPKDHPQQEEVDGLSILRFACFAHEHVTPEDLDAFDFLDRSRDQVEQLFLPYARSAQARFSYRQQLLDALGEKGLQKLEKEYYRKGRRGRLKRLRRKLYHHWSRLGLQAWRILPWLPEAQLYRKWRINRASSKNTAQLFRDLHQARGLTFGINLMRQTLPFPPDVIHAHDLYTLPGAVRLAKQTAARVIYDAHEYEPARAIIPSEEARQLADTLERDCLDHVDRIITVSPSIGDLYRERYDGPPPEIIMNVPEVDISIMEMDRPLPAHIIPVRQQAGLSGDIPLLVFTGGVQREYRGLDKVLEALCLLPECHLVVLGPRHVTNDKWLMDIAERLKVQDRVTLLPPVEARDVPLAIRSADVALCPIQDAGLSYRYCLPNKLFEAAFARVPLCVSDLPEMRRFIEEQGVGRIMNQTDPKCIAKVVQDILNNPINYTACSDSFRKLYEKYNWITQKEILVQLYLDI